MRRAAILLGSVLAAAGAAPACAETVDAGALRAEVTADPWHLRLTDATGATVLEERADTGDAGSSGTLGFATGAGWAHAMRATDMHRDGNTLALTLVTASGPIAVRIAPAGDGAIRLTATPPAAARTTGMGFASPADERFFGFGERSDAVERRGHPVESYVSDGPYRPEDRQYAKPVTPPWAGRDRDDATYYPVPWLLSSRGYGVLAGNDQTSRFEPGTLRSDAWSVEVDAASLDLTFFAGPTPADALRRFTATTGRQPAPATPWAFGPWFQTGQPNVVPLAEEAQIVKTLRDADAPVSAAETQMHFLPCGAQRGNEAYEKQRTAAFHAVGLAHLVYFNPALCRSYEPVYDQARAAGVLQRGPGGEPFTYPAFVGGSGPAGFTEEPLAQFDFTAPKTEAFYERLLREAFDQGVDGWMEDFGESSPPVVTAADGTPADALHNRYPRDYHCTVARIAGRLARPVVRFQRSGWTGAARCASDVWGGDPTTVFGFDGLASAVRQALSIGLSGVSRWGSDIGGYDSFGPNEQLTPELLERWIELGSVSGVMRTKRSGLAEPPYTRPQVYDPEELPVWRRYTKLHTQLYPYLLAADATYRHTGMPLMRALVLVAPGDARALAVDDEFMVGPSLLAAPVVSNGARERKVYAPAGTWVDLWRTVAYDPATGGFAPSARPQLLPGGAEHVLPAPLDELPLLVKAGSVIGMLPPDVDTLAPYGDAPGLVHLADRDGERTLLAFPRGRSVDGIGELGHLGSTEGRRRHRRWVLTVSDDRRRTYEVHATLGTLNRPFTPRRVTVGTKPLPRSRWHYDPATTTLTARFATRKATLRVEGR